MKFDILYFQEVPPQHVSNQMWKHQSYQNTWQVFVMFCRVKTRQTITWPTEVAIAPTIK